MFSDISIYLKFELYYVFGFEIFVFNCIKNINTITIIGIIYIQKIIKIDEKIIICKVKLIK